MLDILAAVYLKCSILNTFCSYVDGFVNLLNRHFLKRKGRPPAHRKPWQFLKQVL